MLTKRLLDILLSATALVLLAPLFLAIAVCVWRDSGLPVFYSQVRVGLGFRRFRIWKFRSMRADRSGPSLTASGDSRITRIGRILRRAKLDELPQLWNVLKGDMSLVGPRPEVPEYVALFRERYRTVLEVRPGLTDLASLELWNEETVLASAISPETYYVDVLLPRKLQAAEAYVARRSLMMDVSILVRTAGAWVRPRPALSRSVLPVLSKETDVHSAQ